MEADTAELHRWMRLSQSPTELQKSACRGRERVWKYAQKLCSREGIVMGVAAGARGDHFWDGFLWGAATAAHQVEGGSVNSDGSACGAPAARMG
jgi:hypothetical protein